MIRVLVTGGRGFADRERVQFVLNALHIENSIAELLHGGATGADQLAAEWARIVGIKETAWPADWNRHGKKAGPLRNQAMVDTKPDVVVAFPGGPGSADCVRRAQAASVPVRLG